MSSTINIAAWRAKGQRIVELDHTSTISSLAHVTAVFSEDVDFYAPLLSFCPTVKIILANAIVLRVGIQVGVVS